MKQFTFTHDKYEVTVNVTHVPETFNGFHFQRECLTLSISSIKSSDGIVDQTIDFTSLAYGLFKPEPEKKINWLSKVFK